MDKELILLVDDDQWILTGLQILLSDEFEVMTALSVEEANEALRKNDIKLVVADLNFEGHESDGIDLINYISKEHTDIPFIVLSGDKETARVVEAMKRNHVDFIVKDGNHDEPVRLAIRRGLERKRESQSSKKAIFKTKSPAVKSIFKDLDRLLATSSSCSILINGESGTGKEYLAQYIAKTLGQKMVAANMASIPRTTAESELFGHKKGAFTGATSNKIGLIEQAHNGVFFLDEIGDCSPELQAKLLRVIQEKEILPVGETRPRKINVRFIAATHKDLDLMVAEGKFRLDLLQRLNTFTFKVPALRDRPKDIEYYSAMFADEFAEGKPISLKPTAFSILKSYDWPGNVRELRNIIHRTVVYSNNSTIDDVSVLKAFDIQKNKPSKKQTVSFDITKLNNHEKTETIIAALRKTNGNRAQAAEFLNIDRATLYRWIKKLEINDIIPDSKMGRPYLYMYGGAS